MRVVDAGGKVSRECIWVMRVAGFAWGTWFELQRQWSLGDSLRNLDRSITEDWMASPIEPSGPLCRALRTLCETVLYPTLADWDAAMSDELRDATDWIDVTDKFDADGVLEGYAEHWGYR